MLDKTAATEALERNESEEAQELENFDVASRRPPWSPASVCAPETG